MSQVTDWAKKRGWWQTQWPKLSLWKRSVEEYAGLENGYWSVVRITGQLLTVGVFFSPQQKQQYRAAAQSTSRERGVMLSRGFACDENGVRRLSAGLWLLKSRVDKINESLLGIRRFLDELHIGPDPVCTVCGGSDALECYRVSHTILLPNLLCPSCLKKLKLSVADCSSGYSKVAKVEKGQKL
jgi:hypothetical protein